MTDSGSRRTGASTPSKAKKRPHRPAAADRSSARLIASPCGCCRPVAVMARIIATGRHQETRVKTQVPDKLTVLISLIRLVRSGGWQRRQMTSYGSFDGVIGQTIADSV